MVHARLGWAHLAVAAARGRTAFLGAHLPAMLRGSVDDDLFQEVEPAREDPALLTLGVLPYLTVIDIDRSKLPAPGTVNGWSSREYVDALTHDQSCPSYNTSFRQLVHIGFRVAAEMGDRYTSALVASQDVIHAGVTNNIFERHLRPIFLG